MSDIPYVELPEGADPSIRIAIRSVPSEGLIKGVLVCDNLKMQSCISTLNLKAAHDDPELFDEWKGTLKRHVDRFLRKLGAVVDHYEENPIDQSNTG